MALRIRTTALADLTQYPGNPRHGNVELIAESLRVNGQYRPIVVQKSTGHILAGNHTALAAESLGWTRLAAVVVDVDDDEARRIVLADNRTSDVGGHDDTALLALLGSVEGLEGTGYDGSDFEALTQLLTSGSYLDERDLTVTQTAVEHRRIIEVRDIPDDVWAAWVALPGDTDLDKLSAALT